MPMYANRSKSGAASKFGHSSSVGAGATPKNGSHQGISILSPADNASDESILRYTKAQGIMVDAGIKRTDEVVISYENHSK
jgi:hypothetical protein